MREAEAAEERAREAHAQGARQGMLAEELRQALSQNQQLTWQLEEHSTQSIQVCRLSVLLPALKQLMLRSDPASPAVEEFHGIFLEDFLQLGACLVCEALHPPGGDRHNTAVICLPAELLQQKYREPHLMRSKLDLPETSAVQK